MTTSTPSFNSIHHLLTRLSDHLLANLIALQGLGVVLPTPGIFFRPLSNLLATYDRDGCSWNRSQLSLDLMADEPLENTSVDWPRSGIILYGIAYRLPPLVRPIDEIGFGLWPTPTVHGDHNRKGASGTSGNGLSTTIKLHLWGTPTARDWKDSGNLENVPENGLLGRMAKSHSAGMASKGSLTPQFHCWLMGFPVEWNDLSQPEMPLFPKYPT